MFRIIALLASGPGQPEGDVAQGIELAVPLSPQGQVDPAAAGALVRRFWPDRDEWTGALEQIDGGWALRSTRGADEPLWELDLRIVRPGEYVSLRRPDGDDAIFRIVSVEPA
ncbi:MAG: hypothetical protein JSR21_11885 [Proteobacteria bacterium]|nr:hypothetical protein [Pseudomonadota bacterium]